jgi:hypothetical protein
MLSGYAQLGLAPSWDSMAPSILYIDKCLLFGLRSAPYLHVLNMVTGVIEWILIHYFGVEHCFHYLDDFFMAGPPMSTICAHSLQDVLLLYEAIQAPVKLEKVLRPSTTLPFLGILLDSAKGEARLPEDKLAALKQELDEFHCLATTHKQCTKRQLLSPYVPTVPERPGQSRNYIALVPRPTWNLLLSLNVLEILPY